MGTPATRTAEAPGTSATPACHTYARPLAGSTVDLDRCRECGCPDGGPRHTSPARIPEARAALHEARQAAVAAIGARRSSGLDDSVIADLDGRIARAMDFLDGLNPRPYLIVGSLPATAAERQIAIPGVVA